MIEYTNHYEEILLNIDCLQIMSEEDFMHGAKHDMGKIMEKGGWCFRLKNTEYVLIAYSDQFGKSKNIVRWFELLNDEPFSMVLHIDPEKVFESLNDEQLLEFMPHMEFFMETVPTYIKELENG